MKAEGRRQNPKKALAVLCVLCALCGELVSAWEPPALRAVPGLPSLNFGAATGDDASCGSAAHVDNLDPFTFCAWIYPTTLTSGRVIFGKQQNTSNERSIYVLASGDLGAYLTRQTGADEYLTNDTPLTTNAWHWICVTYNSAASSGQKINIYHATLTGDPVESTYQLTDEGSGSANVDASGTLVLGNLSTSATSAFQGRIAMAMYWAKEFSSNEVRMHKWRPFCVAGTSGATCRGFWELGWTGTSTQPDLSGGGSNCTVTGATRADHVPKVRRP